MPTAPPKKNHKKVKVNQRILRIGVKMYEKEGRVEGKNETEGRVEGKNETEGRVEGKNETEGRVEGENETRCMCSCVCMCVCEIQKGLRSHT